MLLVIMYDTEIVSLGPLFVAGCYYNTLRMNGMVFVVAPSSWLALVVVAVDVVVMKY